MLPRKQIILPLLVTILIIAVLLTCRPTATSGEPVPLDRAHAHNDYEHERPLYDALDHGFTSVEADIHLVDPLRERVRQNGGRVYPKGPRFTLLIDVKSEAEETYQVLRQVLEEYEEILTTSSPDGQTDGAIVIIISGNRSRETMASEMVRYAAYDGRLEDLESGAAATFIPLVSDKWTSHFSWEGKGDMPERERQKLRDIVETAHQQGRRVRFWATPDDRSQAREAVWRELVLAGVDLINTDDLEGLQQFLLEDDPLLSR